MKLRLVILFLLSAVFCLIACGEPSPGSESTDETEVEVGEAVQILQIVNESTNDVKEVSYNFSSWATGYIEKDYGQISGSAILKQMETYRESCFLVLAVGTKSDETEDTQESIRTISSDGITAYCIDESELTFNYGLLEEGGGDLLGYSQVGIFNEYIIDEPFHDEINADSLVIENSVSVEGIECDVILVFYEGGGSKARWYFGKEDHLPRRVERIYQTGPTESLVVMEICDLNVTPDIDEGIFVLEAPDDSYSTEGYQGFILNGETAPDWELLTSEGNAVQLGDLEGKVVVLDFWATWCGPCLTAMPGLQELHERFAGEPVEIIGINVWEQADPVQYMEENGYTYTLLLKGDEVAEAYMVSAIPTFYVIGPDGRVLFSARGSGEENRAGLENAIVSGLDQIYDIL